MNSLFMGAKAVVEPGQALIFGYPHPIQLRMALYG